MADKIKQIQQQIKSKIENGDELLAVISYVPLVGWIIVSLKSQKNDPLVEFHKDQAKEINLFIVLVYIVLWFLENFPLFRWLFGENQLLHPLTETVWILSLLGYLYVTFVGIYKAFNDEVWSYPFRETIKEKIEEIYKRFIKNKQDKS
ncbi:MAG: hypothetical protein NZ853_11000 [Leptospiraceae bacterium]|nr:hypothetical protein [Leptospiraceae bacterium]MDW7975513.1 hypothetical protein [Leptospiraceae bacterium]